MKMLSKVPKALAGSLAALVMLAAGVSIQNAEPTPEALRNEYIRSLPHRQLRNYRRGPSSTLASSLPHRQLRKKSLKRWLVLWRSLPHRQLRN